MSQPNTLLVNSHIHTPYSFSCFDSVEQAVTLAQKEDVAALGISDFNTVEGYDAFAAACETSRIFALYCIEFIALSPDDKAKGVRWNDPKNPGVIYFCGKALDYPSTFPTDIRNMLSSLWKGTQDHVHRIISALNAYLTQKDLPIHLEYNDIRSRYAKATVRQRHLARAVFDAVEEYREKPAERLEVYRTLFNDPSFELDTSDTVSMQNEIRNRLLKAGKPAYVEEQANAFLSLDEVKKIVLSGGGIPCYPVLADDKAGLNEREADVKALAATLKQHNVHAVEFIPQRNSIEHLRHYVRWFHSAGFCVLFGTEHNTPKHSSLVPSARNGVALDEELRAIGYRGACILAAHQAAHARSQSGFVDKKGNRLIAQAEMDSFVRSGDKAIRTRNGE